MTGYRIVADGPFGIAVAERLATQLTAMADTVQVAREPLDAESLPAFLTGGEVAVRASWREVTAEFARFAAAAAVVGRPWLGVAASPARIRVGPAYVPGQVPCHDCYAARVRQHTEVDAA